MVSVSKISEPISPSAFAAACVLLLTILVGGATHGEYVSSLVARLADVGLLAYCLWKLPRDAPKIETLSGLALIAAVAALALIQLIPLPAAVWTKLPGRGFVTETFQAIGAPLPSMPISLAPDAGWNILAGLAVPSAMFLAAARANLAGRRLLGAAILAGALISLTLAGLQNVSGDHSKLRFYQVTSSDVSVGVFANRDHQAALLVAAIPIAALWAMRFGKRLGAAGLLTVAFALGVVFLIIVGLGVTLSRAGLGLGALALVGALLMVWRTKSYPGRALLGWGLAGVMIVASVLVVVFSFTSLAQRLNVNLANEQRVTTAPSIIKTAEAFSPWGSGFGTFVPAYQIYEAPDQIDRAYLNHAHDDYLEVWVEAGWAGVGLVILALAWIATQGAKAWLKSGAQRDVARAASLIVLGLVLHSVVDYPLRTAAMMAIFAAACGMMTGVEASAEDAPDRHSRRARSGRREVPQLREAGLSTPGATMRGATDAA